MIYFGIDYGTKRVGLACSDETGRFADPVCCLNREPHHQFWEKLVGCINEMNSTEVVVGLPVRTTGEKKSEADRVLKFVEQLKQKVKANVTTWDERFTTKEAERLLQEGNVSIRKRKEKRDMLAAVVMLQSYLDFKRLGNSRV